MQRDVEQLLEKQDFKSRELQILYVGETNFVEVLRRAFMKQGYSAEIVLPDGLVTRGSKCSDMVNIFDIAIIEELDKTHLLKHCAPFLREGGLLIFDINFNQYSSYSALIAKSSLRRMFRPIGRMFEKKELYRRSPSTFLMMCRT